MTAARLERIKEELAWLRMLFTIGIALDASLIAWVAHNYAVIHAILTTLAVTAIAAITVGIIIVFYGAVRRFRQMENL